MNPTHLVVLHHVEGDRDIPAGTLQIPFEQLKEWIQSGEIFLQLFRYHQVICLTYRLEVVSKPFLLSLLLRLLSRGGCRWIDKESQKQEIRFTGLIQLLKGFLRAWFQRRSLLKKAEKKVEELDSQSLVLSPLKLENRPVYLRTDLNFGVRSGGSIGHIAGVLNHLDSFTGKPLFLTSDKILTVRPEVETEVIFPSALFLDFKEIPGFHYNQTFMERAMRFLEGKKISFVYQRYGLNNYSGVELSRKFAVPLILEYNGSEIWVGRHWDKPLKYEKYSEEIEILGLRKASLVVVVSRPLKEELVGRGIGLEKILINPNGVDAQKYSPEAQGEVIRSRFGLGGKVVIGFIGTFGRWHGADILARAFAKLLLENPSYREKIRLLFIGDGVMMPKVKEIAAKLGINPQTFFTGLVLQAQGPQYLAACDILTSPTLPNPDGSPFFGSPTKLFEYMAMGKGIVASDLDQIGEVLRHNETGWLVKPGSVEDLAAGLKALIDDPEKRRKLGEAARREVVAKYTWEEHTRRIIEKLKERCA